MPKRTLLLGLILVTTAANAMEQLRPWVQKTAKIDVRTMKYEIEVPIDGATTVQGVKEFLQREEGIPLEQQQITIIKSAWFGLSSEGITLANDANIKQAMSWYNANRFALSLKLRR